MQAKGSSIAIKTKSANIVVRAVNEPKLNFRTFLIVGYVVLQPYLSFLTAKLNLDALFSFFYLTNHNLLIIVRYGYLGRLFMRYNVESRSPNLVCVSAYRGMFPVSSHVKNKLI